MKSIYSLFFILVIPIFIFGQLSATQHIAPIIHDLQSITTSDLDNDGDLDIIGGLDFRHEIIWFENLDGLGNYGSVEYISSSASSSRAEYIIAFDIDNDGDQDIISLLSIGFTTYYELVWFENLNSAGLFSEKKIIASDLRHSNNIFISDINGDGHQDIITDSNTGLFWMENIGGQAVFSDMNLLLEDGGITWVEVHDIDTDGLLDIVYYSNTDNKFAWLKNLDGLGGYGSENIIDSDLTFSLTFEIADMDNDGDNDLVYSSSIEDEIAWYRNEDGLGFFSSKLLVSESSSDKRELSIFDFDGDNDLDIICALGFNDKIVWYENIDGLGDFAEESIVGSFKDVFYIDASDLDGDSDLDILVASEREIGSYFNLDNMGDFGSTNQIIVSDYAVRSATVADFDGDGDLDPIVSFQGDDRIFWYENTDDENKFRNVKIVAQYSGNPESLTATDFDNDNDIDLLLAYNNSIVFHENLDGLGNFASSSTLISTALNPVSIVLSDLDNDGDEDLISASTFDQKIAWYEKIDGTNNVGLENIISTNVGGVRYVFAYDLDQDGDSDVITCNHAGNGTLYWFENDGLGNFISEHLIFQHSTTLERINFADYNSDDKIDIVLFLEGEKLIYLKNLGSGNFDNEIVLTNNSDNILSMVSPDLDNDGDIDILYSNGDNGNGQLYWLENLDGQGNFGNSLTVSDSFLFVGHLISSDLDEDGDLDILGSMNGGIVWFENFENTPQITGNIFWDENNNGIADPNEIGLKEQKVSIQPDVISSWSQSDGTFNFAVDTGLYYLTCFPSSLWQLSTNQNLVFDVPDSIGISEPNFGLIPISDISEVQTDLTSSPTRCGFTVPFWLSYKNTGTLEADGIVGLELDNLVNFISSDPMPDLIENNTLFWNFNDLTPTYSKDIKLFFEIAGVDFLGDSIKLNSTISLLDDQGGTIFEGASLFKSQINCAYDPNDKLVLPDFPGDINYTLFFEDLEYTIRFQNTGTDTAFNIEISDYLDPNLNWSTFQPIASSHPYNVNLNENGKLLFSFDNILLPDSSTNEMLSHGFVKYRIQPNDNLLENTPIINSANIFFDFNPPIVTNSTVNIMVSEYPEIVKNVNIPINWNFNIYPNPSSDQVYVEFDLKKQTDWKIRIFNSMGQLINIIKAPIGGSSKSQESFSNLLPGVYYISLQAGNQMIAKKLIVL